MAAVPAPDGLGEKGQALWSELHELHEFDPAQTLVLEEACRIADRLDGLNDVINGKGVVPLLHFRMPHVVDDDGVATINLTVDGVLSEARQQANVFKQLIAALRLPDASTGKKPQARGGARGSYTPSGTARVSSLDRARARAAGGS